MKKILTLLFASLVVFSLTMPAFAEEKPKTQKTVDPKQAKKFPPKTEDGKKTQKTQSTKTKF